MWKPPDNANAALCGGGAAGKKVSNKSENPSYKHPTPPVQVLTGFIRCRGHGCYDVFFQGRRLVTSSRDAEAEFARALVALGLSGTVSICDARTGAKRSHFDIERLAQYRCTETEGAPRFRKLTCAERALTDERTAADSAAPEQEQVAL